MSDHCALHGFTEEAPGTAALRASVRNAWYRADRQACQLSSYAGGHIAHIAGGFASGWAFKRSASVDELCEVLEVLKGLSAAAEAIERLEVPDEA